MCLSSEPPASCRLDLAEIFLEAEVWQCCIDFTLFNFRLNKNIWPLDYGVFNSAQCRMCQGVSWDGFESIVPLRPRGVFSKSSQEKGRWFAIAFCSEVKNIFLVLIANKWLAMIKVSFLIRFQNENCVEMITSLRYHFCYRQASHNS